MRKLSTIVLAILAGFVFSAAPATAAPPAAAPQDPGFEQFCFFPAPAGWTRINRSYFSCAECRRIGDAGVSRGDWPDYHCGWFPAGLDIVYYIYLPPAP